MGVVSELIRNVKIPEMIRVKQSFDDTALQDVPGKMDEQQLFRYYQKNR